MDHETHLHWGLSYQTESSPANSYPTWLQCSVAGGGWGRRICHLIVFQEAASLNMPGMFMHTAVATTGKSYSDRVTTTKQLSQVTPLLSSAGKGTS